MTYSIIGIDKERDILGIAVVSGSIAVGSRVPWARYGVGGVVTQAYTNPALGPIILELLKKGLEPRKAMDIALASDEGKEYRQIAIMDWNGRVAFHCGKMMPKEYSAYYSKNSIAIANLVVSEEIPKVMCKAFEETITISLEEALFEAIREAHAIGGDKRGDRSAAIIVVGKTEYTPYYDKVIDIRVDYAENPVEKLGEIYNRIISAHTR